MSRYIVQRLVVNGLCRTDEVGYPSSRPVWSDSHMEYPTWALAEYDMVHTQKAFPTNTYRVVCVVD